MRLVMKLVEWFTIQLACHLRCQVSSTVERQQTLRQRDLIEKQNLIESPSCLLYKRSQQSPHFCALKESTWKSDCTQSATKWGSSSTWSKDETSWTRVPARKHMALEASQLDLKTCFFLTPSTITTWYPRVFPISFPGRTKPPSTNVAKSRETTLDGEISSLWDRKLAYFSSLRSLDSIRVAWDERGTLLKHSRALFLPKLHLGDPPHSGLPNGCRQHWSISASMWLNRLGMVAEWSCIYLFIHFNWGTLRVVLSQFSIECEPHSKSFLFFPARWLISTIWGPPLLFSFFHPQNPISLPFSPPENPYLRTELDCSPLVSTSPPLPLDYLVTFSSSSFSSSLWLRWQQTLKREKIKLQVTHWRDTLAFMFETNYFPKLTAAAMAAPNIDRDYYKCWVGLKQHFDLNAVEELVLRVGQSGSSSSWRIMMMKNFHPCNLLQENFNHPQVRVRVGSCLLWNSRRKLPLGTQL